MTEPDSQIEALSDSAIAGVTRFDPYVSWLDLTGRPQNHYQLLAVDTRSSTAEIEAAASIQLAKLRKYQLGPHREAAEQLMNEVSLACDVLTGAATRKKYDQQLPADAPDTKPISKARSTSAGIKEKNRSGGQFPPIPPVPAKAEIRHQLLICPICSEWWMVSPDLAGRQILCIGCQSSLQVSPDVIRLTLAPEPPPQPQPPAPPQPKPVPDQHTSPSTIVELEAYAALILMIGGGILIVPALLLLIAAVWLLLG